jgi:hypothetical protein
MHSIQVLSAYTTVDYLKIGHSYFVNYTAAWCTRRDLEPRPGWWRSCQCQAVHKRANVAAIIKVVKLSVSVSYEYVAGSEGFAKDMDNLGLTGNLIN